MLEAIRNFLRLYVLATGPTEGPQSGPDIVFRPVPVPEAPEEPDPHSPALSAAPEEAPEEPREYIEGRLVPRHHSEVPRFNGLIECPACFSPWTDDDDGMCIHSEMTRADFWAQFYGVDMRGFKDADQDYS